MSALPAKGPLVAWYGDDFTGSAAVMEALEFAGLPAVLFLDIPTPEQMARFPSARGVGIASTARTHNPGWMEVNLPPAIRYLAATGAPVVHYKVCSTLDSSPQSGSIGTAVDIASRIVPGRWIPCLVASPNMRRYQAFGTLFAGAPEGVFRLDRHPVMARHPVTPMTEADVARHLSRQTEMATACLDLEGLSGDAGAALERVLASGARLVTLDAMTMADMALCGGLIWNVRDGQTFAVGSQGVEYALVEHWCEIGALPRHEPRAGAGAVDRMVAVSGSVSPVTAAQIDWAERNGFKIITLDAAAVACGAQGVEGDTVRRARAALSDGRDPLIVSARGPDDPAIATMREACQAGGVAAGTGNARIGAALGRILRQILVETGLNRAVISGGDTSGHASGALGYYALTALAPTIPGAALMRAWSDAPDIDGLQLALKGGQMGSPDFLGWIKRGGGAARRG